MIVATILAAGVAIASWAATPAEARHRHHHRSYARTTAPSESRSDGRPTCRTDLGVPYDPDIIGGPNHVGDGGPAANLGSGLADPCDPVHPGGPGLLGPR